MFAIILIDHRLALLALAALLIAAAAPLAYAWASLLPEEPPPFEVPAVSPPAEGVASTAKSPVKKDRFAVFLLVCVTLSYLLRFPGLPFGRWPAVAVHVAADRLFYWGCARSALVLRRRAGIGGGVFRAAAEPSAGCFDYRWAAGFGALVGQSSATGGDCEWVEALGRSKVRAPSQSKKIPGER